MRIGIIGGTGKEGRGLAVRWAGAGHDVVIGSRDPTRAEERARKLSSAELVIAGGSNADACKQSEVLVLTVPYRAHAPTLKGLAAELDGKILVDVTVPLAPPDVGRVHLPAGRAAALEAQGILGDRAKVVAALHHVSSAHLASQTHVVDCDVLVCSDDSEAKKKVLGLVGDLGLRALDAGPLANAVALESLTAVLLYLNKKYKGSTAGIRVTGLS